MERLHLLNNCETEAKHHANAYWMLRLFPDDIG